MGQIIPVGKRFIITWETELRIPMGNNLPMRVLPMGKFHGDLSVDPDTKHLGPVPKDFRARTQNFGSRPQTQMLLGPNAEPSWLNKTPTPYVTKFIKREILSISP